MAYGSIIPTQCMETKWTQVDYYDNEMEWIDVLLDNGINPFPDGPDSPEDKAKAIIEE